MHSPVVIGDRAEDDEDTRAFGMQGVDRVMPVDVYVPGCPPRPKGPIYGLLKVQAQIKERRGQWGTYVDRGPYRYRWEGDVR